MEIFKSGLKSVLGGPQDAHPPTGAETVERLVERVLTSTLLDDRRDACRALKALSKKFRLEVGAQAMDALIQVLEQDHADSEITGYALEAICNVISGVQEDDEFETYPTLDEELGQQFTEIFIKKSENVTLLLDLMEEYDFKVRWPVVKLLTALLMHKPKELQDCILVSPMGVSRLMDLLLDTREIIRNDTLLLLVHLTKGNANIQKIVAFENAFDKLLSIIREEGFSDGGVIVEDCLMVLQTLLKNNSSNQTFFREGSYIKYLAPFFELQEASEKGWSPQKTRNVHMMLLVLRVLVSPNNPHQVTLSSQEAMFQCGLLKQLCDILMALGVPADILMEAINTVAEILRGNHINQEYFSDVIAPIQPPRPAIVILLMSMINDKQPFGLRCAVLYCFQCLLYRNEACQSQTVLTLLPSSTTATLTTTVGQLLCAGLFSTDCLSNWFAAVALSHALIDNQLQKEQLLRVQLATGVGNPAVLLINQCSIMLQKGGKLQTRLGLLMLMCIWLSNCPTAVAQFIKTSTNIPFLTSQVVLAEHDECEDIVQGMCAFLLGICIEFNPDNVPSAQDEPNCSREDLCHIIEKRIGLELFLAKLGAVSKNEYYSRAAQNPYQNFKKPSDVVFDYEFCRLFKSLEGTIIKAVQPKPSLMNGQEASLTPAQQNVVQKYKDVIREQDMQIKDLQTKLAEVSDEYEKTKTQLDDLNSTVQQLRDQNALFKAQKAVSGNSGSTQELSQLKELLEELRSQNLTMKKELEDKKQEVTHLVKALEDTNSHQDNKIPKNSGESEIGAKHLAAELEEASEKSNLRERIRGLEEELEHLRRGNEGLKKDNENLNRSNEELRKYNEQSEYKNNDVDVTKLQEEIQRLAKENEEIEEQLSTSKREHEELLILVTEQGDQLNEYRARLKALGENVEDDDYLVDEESEEFEEELSDLKDDFDHRNEVSAADLKDGLDYKNESNV